MLLSNYVNIWIFSPQNTMYSSIITDLSSHTHQACDTCVLQSLQLTRLLFESSSIWSLHSSVVSSHTIKR